MNHPGVTDIVAFLQSAGKWIGDELDLNQLQAGDRLLVRTRNTHYLFLMTDPHTAQLLTDRVDRPSGTVRIKGCVFGDSRMIKPGHLFCGGGLEFTLAQDRRTFTTSSIEAIQLISARPASSSPAS